MRLLASATAQVALKVMKNAAMAPSLAARPGDRTVEPAPWRTLLAVNHRKRGATAKSATNGCGLRSPRDEADAMKITGHQTADVFRHYDIGNVEVLRERLARSRATVAQLGKARATSTVESTPEQRVAR
jgi:hypothetical protein